MVKAMEIYGKLLHRLQSFRRYWIGIVSVLYTTRRFHIVVFSSTSSSGSSGSVYTPVSMFEPMHCWIGCSWGKLSNISGRIDWSLIVTIGTNSWPNAWLLQSFSTCSWLMSGSWPNIKDVGVPVSNANEGSNFQWEKWRHLPEINVSSVGLRWYKLVFFSYRQDAK